MKTKTKMFCACPTHEGAQTPNSNVCAVCLGHPGVLPTPNQEAIRFGLLMGHALECTIAPHSKFDRKNYFYPDLPKAYQISQFDLPIVHHGFVEIDVPGGIREHVRIGITRAHLEEDAAKSFHDASGRTCVDFNRGGTPLLEVVTEPDFRSSQEAKIFLQELRRIARYVGISDADMEKGHLRCDANISLRERDEDGNILGATFHPKTEIKNLNSFKHVERALEYEIRRQTRLWNSGSPPAIQTTRGWNDSRQRTEEQRVKETSEDYRYFPEPDIPPLELARLADDLRRELPELPQQKRQRFIHEYGFKRENAAIVCDDPALADFTEAVFSELGEGEWTKLYCSWMLNKLIGMLVATNGTVGNMKISPESFAEFLTLVFEEKLASTAALTVLETMLADGSDPTHVMEAHHLGKMSDETALMRIIDQVLTASPHEVQRYHDGEKKLLAFFIGQVMSQTEGTADAGMTRNLLATKLESKNGQ